MPSGVIFNSGSQVKSMSAHSQADQCGLSQGRSRFKGFRNHGPQLFTQLPFCSQGAGFLGSWRQGSDKESSKDLSLS